MPLSDSERAILLTIARQSIENGLKENRPLTVNTSDYPAFGKPGACFVTLHEHGNLRGCIGSLEAHRPLLIDIAHNAYAAAFQDPRFRPVQAGEIDDLEIDISILSAPEALTFDSRETLLGQLRPGIDGLTIEQGARRATFLPSVWKNLPDKEEFLEQLKLKAGLPPHWPDGLKAWRYTTESFNK